MHSKTTIHVVSVWAACVAVCIRTVFSLENQGKILPPDITGSLSNNVWTALDIRGNEPPPLSGAALSLFVTPFTITNSTLNQTFSFGVAEWGGFLYGGSTVTTSAASNDTNTTNSVAASIEVSDSLFLMLQQPGQQPYWLQIHRSPTAPWPGPRWRHTAVFLSAVTPPPGQTTGEQFDPYILNVNTLSGTSASGYVVFGGMPSVAEDAVPVADTFILQTGQGFMRSTALNEPPPRWGHIACRRTTSTMLVFGGQTSGTDAYARGILGGVSEAFYQSLLDDTWLYDILTDRWTNITSFLTPPPTACGILARTQASAVRSGTQWYVKGGLSAGGTMVLWQLDVSRVGGSAATTTTGWTCMHLAAPADYTPADVAVLTTPIAGAVLFPMTMPDGAVSTTVAPTEFLQCGGYVDTIGPDVYGTACFVVNTTNASAASIAYLEENAVPTSWVAAGVPVGAWTAHDSLVVGGQLTTVIIGGDEVFRYSDTVRWYTAGATAAASTNVIALPQARMPSPLQSAAVFMYDSQLEQEFVFALASYGTCPQLTSCPVVMWGLQRHSGATTPQWSSLINYNPGASNATSEGNQAVFDSGALDAVGGKFVFAHPWGLPNTLVVVLRTSTGMTVFDFVYTPLCGSAANVSCRHETLTFRWIPRVRFTFPANDTVFLGAAAVLRDVHSPHSNDYFVLYSGGSRLQCLSTSFYTNTTGSNCRMGVIVFSSRLGIATVAPAGNGITAPASTEDPYVATLMVGGAPRVFTTGGVSTAGGVARTAMWMGVVGAAGGLAWTSVEQHNTGTPFYDKDKNAAFVLGNFMNHVVINNVWYIFGGGYGSFGLGLRSPVRNLEQQFLANLNDRAPVIWRGVAVESNGTTVFQWQQLNVSAPPLVSPVGWTGISSMSSVYGYVDRDTQRVLIGAFGGVGPSGFLADSTAQAPLIALACNAGEFSSNFSSELCKPCALGTHALSANGSASTCQACPAGTTTLQRAQVAATACVTCARGYCLHGATCSIPVPGSAAVCRCRAGYSGTRCEHKPPLWLIGLAVAIVALAGVGGWFAYQRWIRPRKTFHVFISYRVSTDATLAEAWCDALTRCALDDGTRIACFLDKKDIHTGSNWETAFLTGLHQACLFMPLVSVAGYRPIEDVSVFDDTPDNVLLEIETALRMNKKRLLGILPLLVGSVAPSGGTGEPAYTPYASFDVSRFPNGPSKTNAAVAVRDTLRQLFKFQGLFVHPHQVDANQVDAVAGHIFDKVWREGGTSLHLKKYWVDAEKRSTVASSSTASDRETGGKTVHFTDRPRHHTANELWDAALTSALLDSTS
eukprot:m.993118 g.993118  ORF g.993118 m.993118 type:complete len:1309 (+) comp24009_c0_seq9:212-4138(+)